MIVRAVLALGVAGVVAGLALDMSGRAPRTAGSNRIAPVAFVAQVPPRGEWCQPTLPLPSDAARVVLTIGTYGHPVPVGQLRFGSRSGAIFAEGPLPAGAHEGAVSIGLKRFRGAPPASQVCLRSHSKAAVALAGEGMPAGPQTELVNGKPGDGLVSVLYVRGGRESWWNLLPTLIQRFGRGKAAVFGDWTLPACALLLVGVWIATLRLLARNLT